MSDTPRTDAAAAECNRVGHVAPMLALAPQLERELAAKTQECEWLSEKLHMLLSEQSKVLTECERLRGELRNIANAKPATWEPDMRDQFQAWAQNRARAALGDTNG